MILISLPLRSYSRNIAFENGPPGACPITAAAFRTAACFSSSPLPSTSLNDPLVDSTFHIGFITPPWKDNKIPVKDHLHAHAYVEPMDLAGWWRGVSYGPLAWYAIDDLIAEIRYVLHIVRPLNRRSVFQNKGSSHGFCFFFVLITTQ